MADNTARGMTRKTCLTVFIAAVLTALPSQPEAISTKELREKYLGKSFHLQYNLFYEDGEAMWVNFIGSPAFVPIGKSVTVKKISTDKATLHVEGMKDEIVLEIEDATPNEEIVLDRLLGDSPPNLEGFDETDLKGITSAKIMIGMTRKGVFTAVGPAPHYFEPPFRTECINRDLKADQLCYAKDTFDFLDIFFEDGKVKWLDD